MFSRTLTACLGGALFLAACTTHADKPIPSRGAPITSRALPGTIAPSPSTPAELSLASGDSAIDVAASAFGPEAALLVRDASGRARVMRWAIGAPTATPLADLPAGFTPRAMASHPAKRMYFISGESGGKSQILAVAADSSAPRPTVVFETPRQIGRLIVSSRPFAGDSGESYRIFFAAALPKGGSSLRSVNEHGRIEYQVVGPASEAVHFSADSDPGGTTAPFGTPMSFHPSGQPLLWEDEHGCAHTFFYGDSWTTDKPLKTVPCDGSTTLAPNGNAYLHWSAGRPGLMVINEQLGTTTQASDYTFLADPVSTPDGRGVIGIVSKAGKREIAYVPLDLPLADVANAWQVPSDKCDLPLFAREGGLFRVTTDSQLYSVYDHYGYADGVRTPLLATTDVFWENFSAAFNGVFILLERQRAMPAFWALVDSANAALAKQAPGSKWANAFVAMADSRKPNPTGEAAQIATAKGRRSFVLDSDYDFSELMPRGHYTASDSMKQYFHAMHYFTEMNRLFKPEDMPVLASLPSGVQEAAWRFIDVYHPFISPSRGQIVWGGRATPPIASYAKHPRGEKVAFPLSWGLDNEVLSSSVFHKDWPTDEQIQDPDNVRKLPTGLDVARVYGDDFALSLLAPDLKRFPHLGPVWTGIAARRPKISDASSVYERWLDALGAEWADSIQFPGAPATSHLWDVKRLQTGLGSWAALREATILVNERPPGTAEAGEGGFEELIYEQPRGYVEPAPRTFDAIADLFTSLSHEVKAMQELEPGLRAGVVARLDSSAATTRRFGTMAAHERRGEPLSQKDYEDIASIGGIAEHDFLVYKALEHQNEGIVTPDPMAKIADVAGDPKNGFVEAAIGNPLEWRQIVPYFGRRQIVIGAVYSYHEFVSDHLYDNEQWRKEVATRPHPAWVQPMIAPAANACHAPDAR